MARYCAVEEKHPLCPKCLSPLPKPDFWSNIAVEDKFQTFTVLCRPCNVPVRAAFLDGRGEM